MQGLGDEGWGLENIVISASVDSGQSQVPEPATLALMGLGLAGIGWRRKKAA